MIFITVVDLRSSDHLWVLSDNLLQDLKLLKTSLFDMMTQPEELPRVALPIQSIASLQRNPF